MNRIDAINELLEAAGDESENQKVSVTMNLDGESYPNFVPGRYVDDDGNVKYNVTLDLIN